MIKINDRIEIKGVPKHNPNHEGRVVQINEKGAFISNMNMPFAGSYSFHFVPGHKVISG